MMGIIVTKNIHFYITILIGRRKDRLAKLSKKLGEKKNLPIQLDVRDKVKVYKEVDNSKSL